MKREPTELPASLKYVNVKSILRKRGVYLKLRLNQEAKEKAIPIARQILSKKKGKKIELKAPIHNQLTDEVVNAYAEKQVSRVRIVEGHFEDKLKQYIGRIEKGFLAQLDSEVTSEKKLKSFHIKGFFDDHADDLIKQAQFDFTPLLESIATLQGQDALGLINSKDVYIPFKYRDVIRDNVAKFATSLIDTDKEHLTLLVNNGIEAGQSVAEIRSVITEDFGQYTKMQAERITRTEVMRVSTEASVDAWKQSGVVEGKQWLIYGAIDECAEYDGEIVTLDGNFYKASEFANGEPPLHPNCKCVLLPVLVNEKQYVVPVNKELYKKIEELEGKIDKRTKAYKELQKLKADDTVYIKSLEKHLGIDDEPQSEAQ